MSSPADTAKLAMQEIARLHAELKAMVENESSTARQRAFSKAKTILARNRAFSLMQNEPPEPNQGDARDNAMVCITVTTFGTLALWFEVASRPEYASLAKNLPVPLDLLLRWVDFVHPIHGRTTQPKYLTGNHEQVITCVGALLLSMARKKVVPFVRVAGASAHDVHLILDLWLHYPRHMADAESGHSETSGTLLLTMIEMVEGLVNDEVRYTAFVSGLRRAGQRRGDHGRHVLRSIAEQTVFLQNFSMPSLEWRWVWELHFKVAALVTQLPFFYGVRIPRQVFRRIFGGVRYCLEYGEDADGDSEMEHAVESAANFLTGLLTNTNQSISLARAIEVGLYGLVEDVKHVYGSDTPYVGYIENHLLNGLSIFTVLRAFFRQYGSSFLLDDLCDEDEEGLSDNFLKFRYSFRIQWRTYTYLTETRPWKRLIACSNTHSDAQHELEVRPCPCGEAFYCSRRCQRAHWHAEHRAVCCHTNGLWGLQGAINLNDALFLIITANRIITGKRAEIESLNPTSGQRRWILVDMTDARPEDFASRCTFGLWDRIKDKISEDGRNDDGAKPPLILDAAVKFRIAGLDVEHALPSLRRVD